MPPVHDPIPYGRVADIIADAEPSRQSAVLHDAWRDYAARAVRPYAWKTFAKYAASILLGDGATGRPTRQRRRSSHHGRTARAPRLA